MFSNVSNISGQVDKIFLFILIVSVLLLLLITFLMIYFVFRYQRKKHQKPENIEGNPVLEIVWTAIPTALVLAMFYFGWIGYKSMRDVPKDAMKIKTIGRMWSWLFEYDNGAQTDTLYVPQGRPIHLMLYSQDVIHSFYMPAFRLKQDCVPGLENNYLWFRPDSLGSYDILCAEYCGQRHAFMLTKVVVMPEDEFDAWYQEEGKLRQSRPDAETGMTANAVSSGNRGDQLVKTKGCVACHSSDGSLLVGPSFKGILGRQVTVIIDDREQMVVSDEAYLRRAILEPNTETVKGFDPLMPQQKDQISEADLNEIIAYLKELK